MFEEIARNLGDGSLRLLAEPNRRLRWHRPKTVVPALQWSPDTGMTRYEWARQHTPARQRPFFEHLQRLYRMRPPVTFPADLAARLSAAATTQPNGMPGFTPEDFAAFRAEIERCEISETDPTGEWRFQILAEWWRGVLCDRLAVSCRDYRTLPDWELLVRLRAWVLDDDREALIWLPDCDPSVPGWEGRYENARPNNLQMISPRLVQPDGTRLAPAAQSAVTEEES